VVYSAAFEKQWVNPRAGSNPAPSANFHFYPKRRERACREATRNAIFALRVYQLSKSCGFYSYITLLSFRKHGLKPPSAVFFLK
jgi:hypothetical protein